MTLDSPADDSLPPSPTRRDPVPIILFLGAILLIAAYGLLTRNDSPQTLQLAHIVEKRLSAIRATKIALNEWPATERIEKSVEKRFSTEILALWRALADAPEARPSDLRRLGIVQELYGEKDALKTFRRITTLPLVPDPNVGKGMRLPSIEPKPALHPAAEVAMWEAIYGPAPLRPEQIPQMKSQLASLKLGWFEHLAEMQLYRKAGQLAEAEHALQKARASARRLQIASLVQVSGLILGSLVWLLLFCYGLVTWSVNQRHVYPQSVPPAGQKKAHARPVTAYAPRIKTFLLFLVFPIAIATLLQPLRLRTVHWSPQSVWRFNSILYALTQALMLVTVLLALWRLSGRPAFADFLKSVGLYTRNIRTDLGVAVGLYCLALPVLTAVTVLSGWFFRGFDTPPHPTLIWIQVLDSPLDRSLTYLQAALIAPIVEEVIFRGVLYPALRERWGVLTGIALSSVLFSLMHPNLPGGFLPLAALGASFAVAFQLRGSLLPGILMHSLHNFLTLYMQFAVVSS